MLWFFVAYPNESHFQICRVGGQGHMWRRLHQTIDPAFKQGVVPDSVITWSAFSEFVRTNSEIVLTHAIYTHSLKQTICTPLSRQWLALFQHDYPSHRAQMARKCFQKHSGILMPAPRLPDLNPIKHIWDMIENSLNSLQTKKNKKQQT